MVHSSCRQRGSIDDRLNFARNIERRLRDQLHQFTPSQRNRGNTQDVYHVAVKCLRARDFFQALESFFESLIAPCACAWWRGRAESLRQPILTRMWAFATRDLDPATFRLAKLPLATYYLQSLKRN